jgi:hypothetical protein
MKWDSHLGVADSAHAFHVGSRAAISIGSTFGDWGQEERDQIFDYEEEEHGEIDGYYIIG